MFSISEQNIVESLLNEEKRKFIIEKINSESGSKLPFTNLISEISLKALLTVESVNKLKECLLNSEDTSKSIFENFIFNPTFPHEMLYELLNENKFIHSLAHRSGPIDLLLKIARTKNSPDEALLTVGDYYYFSPKVSPAKFQSFIEEFTTEEHLLVSLTYKLNGKDEKSAIFEKVIQNLKDLKELYQEVLMEKKLLSATDKDLIEKQFYTKKPKFLRSISQNMATPINILEKLVEISNIKYASSIRENAFQTLEQINKKN